MSSKIWMRWKPLGCPIQPDKGYASRISYVPIDNMVYG